MEDRNYSAPCPECAGEKGAGAKAPPGRSRRDRLSDARGIIDSVAREIAASLEGHECPGCGRATWNDFDDKLAADGLFGLVAKIDHLMQKRRIDPEPAPGDAG